MGRARVPSRREGDPEANGAFSSLIREGYGLRERRIARTRSLPALGAAAAGLSRSGSLWSVAPVYGLVGYGMLESDKTEDAGCGGSRQ